MTVTGRPWDELEETLTWPRIDALCRYWQQHPPIHELAFEVASVTIGIKPKQPRETGGIEEIMALFNGGVLK